jgi:hypothetical protein
MRIYESGCDQCITVITDRCLRMGAAQGVCVARFNNPVTVNQNSAMLAVLDGILPRLGEWIARKIERLA